MHERSQHPESFHREEVEALSAASRKVRWDPGELALMATFESQKPGVRFMNQEIRAQVLPHRSIEAIKGARKTRAYKDRLEALRTRGGPSGPAPGAPASPTPASGSASPVTPRAGPPDLEPPTQSSAEDVICTYVQELSISLGLTVPSRIDEVEAQVDLWCPPRAYAYRPPGVGNQVSQEKKAKRKRQYRRIQRLWRKERGRAVKEIITGIPDGPPIIPPRMKEFWAGLFGRSSLHESRSPSATRPTLNVTGPITEDEIKRAIKTTKPSTAPGPDGRRREDVSALSLERLGWAYNTILLLKDVPQSWARGRTTLIPKNPEAKEPGDFRPITITSLLLRIYHKILVARLMAAAPLPMEQKGFAPEEGVAANILLLQELINSATSNKTNLCVAFIDFKKAFDSVSHPSLVAATKRWGFPPELTEYIRTLYDKASTSIMGDTCPIRRGVLQGDPLSPYLFNITLDWALSQVPADVGARLAGTPIPYIAYADDVALTASTPCGLQASLNALAQGAAGVGLEIGLPKCATLYIRGDGKRKRWLVDTKTTFEVSGEKLKALGPGETYKYLGLELGPAVGRAEPRRALAALIKDLGSIQAAPLKPQQKLWALKNVVIPKHQYSRVLGKTTKGNLQRMDCEVRKFVKKALHLPKDTPNAGIYTRTCEGGLGVPRLTVLIPALKRGALERLCKSHDNRVARIAEALLQTPSLTSKELREQSNIAHKQQLYASADGRGLSEADGSPPTHGWVDDGTLLMRGATYINAIKTRLGVVNTKLRSSRGRAQAPVLCDLGCGRVESLGHILQTCPRLAPERTHRHDRVLSLLLTQLKKHNHQVLREPNIRTQAGLRKPDVVVWNQRQSVVLDVQITSDSSVEKSLEVAHGLKRSYYDVGDIRDWVRTKTGYTPVFATLTINWRGIMATPSYMALKTLGLSKNDLHLLTVRSLEGSVAALRSHRGMGGWG